MCVQNIKVELHFLVIDPLMEIQISTNKINFSLRITHLEIYRLWNIPIFSVLFVSSQYLAVSFKSLYHL